jgi:hypothetical protein
MAFHPPQVAAATNILAAFSAGTTNYALLIAEMQSGKTGAFQCLINQALTAHLVDRVYLLCGSAETVLRDQAHDDTVKFNAAAKTAGQITIYFRQAFSKSTSVMNTHRALIVIDESHLDSFNGSEMMVFLARHGLTLQGTSPAMTANQTYICSVSATPYAELAKIRDGSSLPKHVEYLQPGPGYYGLRDYEAAGLLRPSFNIAENVDTFRDLLTSVTASTPKWILLRIVQDEDSMEAVRTVSSIIGMPILEYNSARKDVAITRQEATALGLAQSLETPPTVPTIVHIKGTCRVGKVLPKHHIAFVWENSKSSSTDTMVQALPGRMCGYDLPAEKPVLYVPSHILKDRESTLTLSEGDDDFKVSELDRHSALTGGKPVIPTKGMNLGRSRFLKREDESLTQTPPFLMDMSDQTHWTDASMYARLTADNCVALKASPMWSMLTDAQQDELSEYLSQPLRLHVESPRSIHIRRLTPSNANSGVQHRYFAAVIDAHRNQTSTSDSWTLHQTSVEFHVVEEVKPGLPTNTRVGHVYCIFYTVAAPTLESIPLRCRIPETDTDTIFDSFSLTEELMRTSAAVVARRVTDEDYDDETVVSVSVSMSGGGGASSSITGGGSVSVSSAGDPTPSSPSVTTPIPTTTVPVPAVPEPISYWGVPLSAAASENPDLLRAFLLDNIRGPSGSCPITPAFRLSKTAYHFTGSQSKGHDLRRIVKEIGDARGLRVSFDCGTGSDYTHNFYVKSFTWAPK